VPDSRTCLWSGTAQQELRNDISYGVAPGTVDQASRAWLQLLGHIMVGDRDTGLISTAKARAQAVRQHISMTSCRRYNKRKRTQCSAVHRALAMTRR